MPLRCARLTNVRSHSHLSVQFGPGFTVLVGANGVGKTSVLEAVHLVLAGTSPRTASPRELIRQGEDVLRVEADLTDASGDPVTASFAYDRSGERRTACAGVEQMDCSRVQSLLPVRMFLPDHLQLVKGGPRPRRQYLDRLAGAHEPAFRREAAAYDEALRQRNHLLRQGIVGGDHRPWEAILAGRGLAVVEGRRRLLARFAPLFAAVHARLVGGKDTEATVVYRTTTADLDEDAYRERLADDRTRDRQSGLTRLGPHRDDLRVLVAGRDLRDYGSQGEQRTGVLALLLAERAWLEETQGEVPLLLLDDVMSELDGSRRRALLSLLEGGQAVITTTDLHYFTPSELEDATVIALDGPPEEDA